MVIIAEGIDNSGKGTQIQKIKEEFEKRGISVHILHYSNIKAFGNDNKKIREASYKQFRDMFKLINYAAGEDSMALICDRAHLGECVYSPIYRDYSGDFVFEESAIEIKSTLSQENTSVLINNENQLDCNYPQSLSVQISIVQLSLKPTEYPRIHLTYGSVEQDFSTRMSMCVSPNPLPKNQI